MSLALSRILVVKLSSLGDLFHPLPAVRQLKAATGATVDWLVQPDYADLVRCFRDVDNVLVYPRRHVWRSLPGFVASLRHRAYDLVVDFQGLLKSAWPARLARLEPGGRRIGPSFAREGSRLFYSALAGPRNKNRHAVEENLDICRFLNLPETTPEFPLRFPRQFQPGARPRVALAPASRWPTKNWPVAHAANLADGLVREAGATVFLVGGPAESATCAEVAAAAQERAGVHTLAGRTTLVDLGSVLQEMDLLVTVDSGPMHMAAALGVPVLALFGPTDPSRTGPYGPGHRVLVVERVPCRPCFSNTCARGDFVCLQNLFPSRVLAEAVDMLHWPARQERDWGARAGTGSER